MIFNDEIQLIRETARNFAHEELKPNSSRWDKNAHFPEETLNAMAKLGFLGMLIPEMYGGSNVGYLAYCLVIEEIARGDGATSTIVSVHNSVGCLPIYKFGTNKQKEIYLPKMCRGEWLGAFCLTEPQAGSDAKNIKTRAQVYKDAYVLNGVKQFVTNGKHASIAIVFAKTADVEKNSISAFIVPTTTPGFTITRVEHKMGQKASEIAQITLENCKLPKENLLGEQGQGYKIALSN
ncbi:MAG TPA: acyl-CoA dehydrogenase family protein, partial [Gammaproteobacteria bacterium]|nr:acyl-CoA dehydrogenase family protein [Gammaproteobacteria bacterium]